MKIRKFESKENEKFGVPEKVKIINHWYKVILCNYDDIDEKRGEANLASLEIKIQKNMSRTVTWAIFLKSIFSVISPTTDARVIEPLANSLLDFLMRNNLFKKYHKTIPSTVLIGPHTYQVILSLPEEGLEQVRGDSNCRNLRIRIRKDMNKHLMWETFLHEVLHQFNNEIKEIPIEAFATGIFGVLVNAKVWKF